ncbi:hypothetical protein [Neogemmobacter tilapiae]|uniref:Type II secretion system protein M n=1 Tax=Neogemmobacter tilapiae TaxID=875041 RepID=A0A918U114_9RHOB|nr:hypothetical protein [Gemmobacter tilapiae]GHC65489.1 hypothetical protein GCM10007315_32630 [Gemmobacter tilapiae]
MMGVVRQVVGLALVGLLAIATVLLLTAQGRASLAAQQDRAEELADAEAALLRRAALLRSTHDAQDRLPKDLSWKAESRAAIEIALQDRLVTTARKAGLRVISFGPTNGPQEISRETMGFELEMDGGHREFAEFLAAVESTTPYLAFSYLWVRQQPGGEAEEKAMVSLRLAVWAFVDLPDEETAP